MNPFLVLLLLLALSVPTFATPAHVIVIRHGEKPKDHEAKHLSPAGEQRAERLVEFVKSNPELVRLGAPNVLMAALPTKDGGGQRTGETLAPLSTALKVAVETPFESDHSRKLALRLLEEKQYDGKNVLICWTHEHIPELIEALGIHPAPEKLGDDVYDLVYVVSYGEKEATLQTLHQDMPSAAEGKKSKLFHFGKKKAKP